MPIDFPNNPIAGQTYSYGSQQWKYNGVAWDKTSAGGATGATGATGPQGEPGQSSNYYNYKVHATTQTPPTGNGEIRYNNATQVNSTELYVDHLNNDGDDIDVFLSLLKQNDNLIIQDASDSNNYQTWKITSAPTVILNDYTTIPVTGVTSAGTGTTNFANNHNVLFIVFSSPIATEYVSSIRGLTGAVGLTNGSGIGLSVSGQTMTFSNTGVLSFNGLTGAVTGVTTGVANTFGPLQSFTNGISSSGGTFSALTRFTAGISSSFVRTLEIQGPGGAYPFFTDGALRLQQLGFPSNNYTTLIASSTVDQTITLPDDTGTVALTKNVVSSFNGLTGAVTGVRSVRGLTGAVGITNGSGIGLSVSGQTMTFSNTGVLSIDGGTGAITNVARTNITNTFTASPQIISGANAVLSVFDSASFNEVAFQGEFNRLYFYNDISSGEVYLQPTIAPASTITVSLPNYTTTLAGLAGTQTFTGTNTFNTLTNFPGGISAAGATFSSLVRFNAGISAAGATFGGNLRLQNGEFLQNTTNGRMDFMPAPGGSTHYGLYVDMTSWGFGPALGTIRSSDGALNTGGQIRWDVPLVMGNDVNFSFGANQQNLFRLSTTGNDTVQFSTTVTTGTNSGALALVDSVGLGTANRSPGVTHSNPNLYVYRAGSASANDFIRIEHNGTNGRIVSGGTSGISIEPGSGIVGVSGGISASSGMTLTGTFNLNGQTFNNVVSAINGFTGNIGAARWPIGQTSGSITVLTFPSGTTSFGTKIPYYIPHQNVSGAGTATGTVTANRVYFTLFHTPRDINLHTLRINAFSTGITGNCHFGVYDVNPNSGLPRNLLYSSASIAVASGFGSTTVSNASGLVSVPAGYFYIATVFNNTPSMYGLNTSQLPVFGADTYTSGYLNSSPFADPGGFTLPASLPSAGLTFGFIDYIPAGGPIRGMFVDYRIV